MKMKEKIHGYINRLILLILGIIIMATSGTILYVAKIGGDSILVFQEGFSILMGLEIGWGILLVNALLSIITFFINKKMINIGTIAIIVLVGPIVELVKSLNIIPVPTSMIMAIIMVIIACITLSFGLALYIYANIGYAPFEGIMLTIKQHTKVRYAYIKISSDIVLFVLGYLMGGTLLYGSLLTVILVGPITDFFLYLVKKTHLVEDRLTKNI